MRFFRNKLSAGSTLIELIIAVMVVGLIVTAVANAVTHSIKNTGEARFQQVATVLGQQVVEHFRIQKNSLGMINLYNSLSAQTYCYSDIDNPSSGTCGPADTITMAGTDFTREVAVLKGGAGTTNDPYYLTLTVTVEWQDGTTARNIELVQQLKQAN